MKKLSIIVAAMLCASSASAAGLNGRADGFFGPPSIDYSGPMHRPAGFCVTSCNNRPNVFDNLPRGDLGVARIVNPDYTQALHFVAANWGKPGIYRGPVVAGRSGRLGRVMTNPSNPKVQTFFPVYRFTNAAHSRLGIYGYYYSINGVYVKASTLGQGTHTQLDPNGYNIAEHGGD